MDAFVKEQMNLVLRDLSTLGGLFLYSIVVLIFFFIGEKEVALRLIIGTALMYVIVSVLRLLYFTERPKKRDYHNVVEKIDAGSFPSMHMVRTTFLFGTLFHRFNDLRILLLFTVLLMGVGYSRVYLKNHYLKDLIVGVIIGGIVLYCTETFINF